MILVVHWFRCVHLVAELSQLKPYIDKVSSLLPLVAESARHKHYAQHYSYLETVFKQVTTVLHFQRRYEMITCSDENAVSSLLSPCTLHSELRWQFSRVIPWDPQAKTVWLWSVIETTTFELEIPWGSCNFSSTQQLYSDMPTMTRIGMHKNHVEYLMISYLLCFTFIIGITLMTNNFSLATCDSKSSRKESLQEILGVVPWSSLLCTCKIWRTLKVMMMV